MRILKEETNNLKALISEKESCNENLNKLMDEIAGLKDNKARITIFQKQKNEKHQVELELYELKRKCKCGASQ